MVEPRQKASDFVVLEHCRIPFRALNEYGHEDEESSL